MKTETERNDWANIGYSLTLFAHPMLSKVNVFKKGVQIVKIIFLASWLILATFTEHTQAITWPNNAASAVSISADDGWWTQLVQATILEDHGFRGTFYLSPNAVPSAYSWSIPYWRGVFERGHEVANHSYYHRSNLNYPWGILADDVAQMEWWLLQNIYSMKYTDHTYAFPNGYYVIGPQSNSQQIQVGTCEYTALLSAAVSGARIIGVNPGDGMNDPAKVAQRRFFIKGIAIEGPDAVAVAEKAIDDGIEKGTWTNLVFHQLNDLEYGDPNTITAISQSDYTKIIDYIASKQSQLWVAPIVNVNNYIIANTPSADWSCKLPAQ